MTHNLMCKRERKYDRIHEVHSIFFMADCHKNNIFVNGVPIRFSLLWFIALIAYWIQKG
ncbi:hypothetical protein EV147_2860 [Cupriavidus agavae]|uniref:Uncharacterized protein n=1 Tax=Cupriavidus agavae TaxID=1001822 RepID=A0A4Q7RWU2_9BURK|nr:hypothetical protein EV147_2860 [Cupriavidus agavae]